MKKLADLIKRIVSLTPEWFQEFLRGIYFRRLIANDKFDTPEPEFIRLGEFVESGDWVIDIGANIGQYTLQLSRLVGPGGRVIAFEPIPVTFAHLANNASYSKYKNVTLINAAVSSESSLVGMSIPYLETGLHNYYMASVSDDVGASDVSVLTLSVDSFQLQNRVSLIKIDAEGHEPLIFKGMLKLVARDRPALIIESVNEEMREQLTELGYREIKYPGSPNLVYRSISRDLPGGARDGREDMPHDQGVG